MYLKASYIFTVALSDFLRVNFQLLFQEIFKAEINLATTHCYVVSGDIKI